MVEFNMSVIKPIMVSKKGRSITIQPNIQRLAKHEHGMRVRIGGAELPVNVKLVSGVVTLDEKVYEDEVELVLDETLLGEGPNRVRAVAVYADGMEVSSPPFSFGISFAKD